MTKHLARIVVASLLCAAAYGQFGTGFEAPGYAGSASGTVLTGQNGWYIPVTPSADFRVYTYDGNTLNMPQNPCGEEQFVAGFAGGANPVARAQLDLTYPDQVVITVDMCVDHPASLAAQNVGSLSLNPNGGGPTFTNKTYIHLFSWVDVNNVAAGYRAFYLHHNADGTQIAQPGAQAGPEWTGLQLRNWYRLRTTVDFIANKITRVSIQNLTAGGSEVGVDVSALNWWLGGGQNSTLPKPTQIRMFSGGSAANPNFVAYDNLGVGIDPGCPSGCDPCDTNCDGSVNAFDIQPFVDILGGSGTRCSDCSGDTNGDGSLNGFDIQGFVDCLGG